MAVKQDSNVTGLRFAEQTALGTLPGSPVWYPLEPNSYDDFGGELRRVARNPINPTRQRKKGTIVDLDASGGFNQDLTMGNATRILQGFLFADVREKATNIPMNGSAVVCTSVTAADDKYNFGADPGAFAAGDLFLASGFTITGNNGLKVVTSTDADDVTVAAGLTDETPPSDAKLQVVGRQLGSGTSAIALNGDLVRLTDSATNLTTLGLLAGEWIFIGGDGANLRFADNQGYARISAIAAGYLEFDKVTWTPSTEAGTGDTIQIFFGSVIRNEPDKADIVRRLYNVERTLGEDDNGEMSEYLEDAVPNELTINVPEADKVTMDMSFIALNNAQRTGAVGVKSGSRPDAVGEDAINTSSDFARLSLSLVSTTDATVTPLFGFCQEMSITVNNNVSPLKAIGTLGGFETNTGGFDVSGSMTVYFADVEAVQAVRDNADVTLDMVIAKANKGIILDLPLVGLGDGRLNIEQDQAIKLPLETNAAESAFGYTMLMNFFPYLPTLAM